MLADLPAEHSLVPFRRPAGVQHDLLEVWQPGQQLPDLVQLVPVLHHEDGALAVLQDVATGLQQAVLLIILFKLSNSLCRGQKFHQLLV